MTAADTGMRTPGPWVMEFTGPHSETRDGYWEIAPMGPNGEPDWDREVAATADDNEANAHLLTAAPDLLSALKRLRDLPVDCSQEADRAAWAEAHAAIAKAEGTREGSGSRAAHEIDRRSRTR